MTCRWTTGVQQMLGLSEGVPKDQGLMLILGLGSAVVLWTTIPFEIPELTMALMGAFCYAMMHLVSPKQGKSMPPPKAFAQGPWRPSQRDREASFPARSGHTHREKYVKKDYRQPSIAPILPTTFQSVGWDAEVAELLTQIMPTAEGDKLVKGLVRSVKQAIWPIIPEAEVMGFTSGNPARGRAYGVAVPEIDIVVSADPSDLIGRLNGRLSHGGRNMLRVDPRKLQKAVIRACTDQLVSKAGFKFRRSAFRSDDPKVTLLAPASMGLSEDAVSLDFSVNSALPLHSAALLTECGHLEPRAKELTLLVRRWARDRGISHSAKGHLTPYAWSLLAIYFLQTGTEDGVALLPSLSGFERSAELARKAGSPIKACKEWSPVQGEEGQKSTAALFKEFVHFYASEFDYRNEAVSVRLGRRKVPEISLPLHVLADDINTVAPSIEDPFDVRRNLGSNMTSVSFARLNEELARADALCSSGCTLAALLEVWVPPEQAP
eukprot:CAMPEP_0170592102 /NCGR_PEP_ID=MMETSP0224-20130122/12752_1 /TAXON_ID=285029 /ORGANISM="Togula jolla, Strain CCCM 725" /LENGTH=491 /DNA_ID=CAMNT_0010915999 /DNA_START=119 /DNA_END=1594 /DNA_ORIENTATION=+